MLKNKNMVPENSRLIDIVYNYTYWKVLSFVDTEGLRNKNMVLPIYLSNPIISIMLPYDLLFTPRSFLSSLDQFF